MSFFLLTFSRGDDGKPVLERFDDGQEAMAQFTAAERLHRQRDDGRGVVLLVADDEATLRRTHTHYFESAAGLLASVAGS